MGLWELILAGAGFMTIGIWQAYAIAKIYLTKSGASSSNTGLYRRRPYHAAELSIIALFALVHIWHGVSLSIKDPDHGDSVGFAIELEKSGVASIFLLYSITGLICECTRYLVFPWEAQNLIALFAFGEEFLMFYLQRDGPAGLENRYYSLLLVPISVCLLSKALEIPYPKSVLPPLACSAGLILQGTWLIQMGISFYTRLIPEGCKLSEKASGDYTIHCTSHPDFHRGKAIATLQFNGHMALLLVCLLPAYSYLSTKHLDLDSLKYKPLSIKNETEELQELGSSGEGIHSRFALDSDEDEPDATLQPQSGTMPAENSLKGSPV